jgi:periplasmic divalent cation tolerance protein
MTDLILVLTTVPEEEAEALARTLVEERLAACVNRVPGLRSTYRWRGQVERADEELLIIKSRADLFASLKHRIVELHSYDVPEIIALPIIEGSEPYVRWLDEEIAKR